MSMPQSRPNGPPAYIEKFRQKYGHLVKRLSEGTGSPYAILSFKGKVWSVRSKGEKRPLTNEQGDPIARLQVVILDAAPQISKKFYGRGFVEGSDDPPDCQSADGVTSDPNSPNRQHVTCADCPLNQWGSRITEQGKKAKMCADNRRLALMAVDDVGVDEPRVGPMLLNVPPASLGSLATYGDQISRHGLIPQAVVTSIGFNPAKAYQELVFRGDGILPEDQIEWVIDRMENDPTIKRILSQLTELEETGAANARKEPSSSGTNASANPQPANPPAPEPAPAPPPPPQPQATAATRGRAGPGRPRQPSPATSGPAAAGAFNTSTVNLSPMPSGKSGGLTDPPAGPTANAQSANGGANVESFEVDPAIIEELTAATGSGEAEGAAGDTDAEVREAAEGQNFDQLWNALSTATKQ